MAAEQVRREFWARCSVDDALVPARCTVGVSNRLACPDGDGCPFEPWLSVSDAAWHVERVRGDAPPGVFSNEAWHAALDAVVERLDLGEGN